MTKKKEIKKTSKQWAEQYNIGGIHLFGEYDKVIKPIFTVMDPDGWDRVNYEKSINEKISLPEFINRIAQSSLTNVRAFLDWIKTISDKEKI